MLQKAFPCPIRKKQFHPKRVIRSKRSRICGPTCGHRTGADLKRRVMWAGGFLLVAKVAQVVVPYFFQMGNGCAERQHRRAGIPASRADRAHHAGDCLQFLPGLSNWVSISCAMHCLPRLDSMPFINLPIAHSFTSIGFHCDSIWNGAPVASRA